MRKDPRKAEKLARLLTSVQQISLLRLRQVLNDPSHPDASAKWSDCSASTRIALNLAGTVAAQERAKTNAQAAPKTLGVVVVTPRIEGKSEWEAMARAVNDGRQVIEVEAVPVAELPEPEKK